MNNMTIEEKETLMLGKALKIRADSVNSWITEYYNRGLLKRASYHLDIPCYNFGGHASGFDSHCCS